MLTWHDLSKAQKKWVTLVQMFHPEVRDTVTFQQIKEFHAEFMEKRSEGKKFKTGMPLWLITHNAIERGVYFFPSEENTVQMEPEELTPIDPEFEPEYQQELAEYGLV